MVANDVEQLPGALGKPSVAHGLDDVELEVLLLTGLAQQLDQFLGDSLDDWLEIRQLVRVAFVFHLQLECDGAKGEQRGAARVPALLLLGLELLVELLLQNRRKKQMSCRILFCIFSDCNVMMV